MGFWNNRRSSETLPSNWEAIESIEELDAVLNNTEAQTQVLFKHSTRCGISMAAKRRMQSMDLPKNVSFYYVDLLQHRDVSNAIASKTGVMHQSPQLVILKDGQVVGHGSHESVNQDLIKSYS